MSLHSIRARIARLAVPSAPVNGKPTTIYHAMATAIEAGTTTRERTGQPLDSRAPLAAMLEVLIKKEADEPRSVRQFTDAETRELAASLRALAVENAQ